MYELLSIPHESKVMPMWECIYRIFNDVRDSHFAFRPKPKDKD